MINESVAVNTDLFSPDFIRNPHPIFARLREQAPVNVGISPNGVRMWVISRYDDVLAAFSDPRLCKSSQILVEVLSRQMAGTSPLVSHHMLFSDPPDHTRLRGLVAKAFTARRVQRLRTRMEEITEDLLGELAGGSEVDLMDVLAYPLPITVISEMLGIPAEDRGEFREWTTILTSAAAPNETKEAGRAMADFVTGLLAAKRAEPADDLLSALVQASEGDDRLSEEELVAMVFLLLTAGFETTVNLIANGLLALLCHPDQLALLRQEPSLLPNAVTEFLRFDSPVNLASMRFTAEPVDIGGVVIPEGEIVMIGISSANRDSARFPDPDRLDITRWDSGHLSFGHGIHHCLGAMLARIEVEAAIGQLIRRFPGIHLAVRPDELRYRFSLTMRSLERLPVVLSPAA